MELPLTHHELYKQIGIDPPRGVLLYGVPGTGKTMLAKAVAHHTTAAFIRVVGSEFVQKYLGEARSATAFHVASNLHRCSDDGICHESVVTTPSLVIPSYRLWSSCQLSLSERRRRWFALSCPATCMLSCSPTCAAIAAVAVQPCLIHAVGLLQGPRMVRDVFRLAKENEPAIIFIDEVDAIATARFDAQTGADRCGAPSDTALLCAVCCFCSGGTMISCRRRLTCAVRADARLQRNVHMRRAETHT